MLKYLFFYNIFVCILYFLPINCVVFCGCKFTNFIVFVFLNTGFMVTNDQLALEPILLGKKCRKKLIRMVLIETK